MVTASSLVFWFAAVLTLVLAVFLVAALRPSPKTANRPPQQPPAGHGAPRPRHARDTAAPAATPPLPAPGHDPEGPAPPAAPGGARPPWEPATVPTETELIRATAEQLTRLLYGWRPDIRLSDDNKTAVALSDLRSAIDASLLSAMTRGKPP